jgi:protein-S-isoprenylcysteine O-methyltransferase Ste14
MSDWRPLPPTYFWLCLLVSLGLHFLWPVYQLIPSPYTWLGILLIVGGAWITIWTDQLFKKAKTAIKPADRPSVLVTEGPFRISRNPMYVGMAAVLAGVAAVLGSVTSFVGPLGFTIAMATVFIPVEEKSMASVFGSEYRQYRGHVRRWL